MFPNLVMKINLYIYYCVILAIVKQEKIRINIHTLWKAPAHWVG
jgi:hypothetical protein